MTCLTGVWEVLPSISCTNGTSWEAASRPSKRTETRDRLSLALEVDWSVGFSNFVNVGQ
jgi:hypothetical protein